MKFCSDHKKEDMVYRSTRYKIDKNQCIYCACDIDKEETYCKNCKVYEKIGKTIKRKQKELEIKNLLDAEEIKFTNDLTVKDGCSKKRPDFIINTNWGIIILEVDEHQHNRKTYDCKCEITRMRQLYFDCGVENLLFIRYNPDKYIPVSGSAVNKAGKQEFLLKYLKENIETTDHRGLGVIYLFYDGFLIDSAEIEKINPYDIS